MTSLTGGASADNDLKELMQQIIAERDAKYAPQQVGGAAGPTPGMFNKPEVKSKEGDFITDLLGYLEQKRTETLESYQSKVMRKASKPLPKPEDVDVSSFLTEAGLSPMTDPLIAMSDKAPELGEPTLNQIEDTSVIIPSKTSAKPMPQVDSEVIEAAVEEPAPVTAETESAGLMSKPLTDDDMGLPDSKVPAPDLAFIKNAGTKQGDNERSVYEYAYEQGLEGDELKSFMSQVAHESRTFGKLEEDGYTRANVNDISTARYKTGDTYKGQPLTAGDPMVGKFKNINRRRMVRDGVTDSNGVLQNYSADNVHNSMYAGRMGNGDFASGDGIRYKGRGYIQLTGRDNYRLIGEDIGEDLENNPDLMLDPKIAEKASVAWWKRNVQTRQPDYTDVEAVTRIVNGGVNGLTDRRKKFNRYNETVTTPTRTPRPQARD